MDSRLAVIMVTDLAGYSSLMEEDPSAAIAQVRRLREVTLEPVIEEAGGHVEKRMGDGWLITFPSVTPAIQSAQNVQNVMATESGLKLRTAVHMGEIVEEDGELYGTGINIAARLQAQAPPGGVILSADCQRLLDPTTAAQFADAGSLSLKNVKQPVACFQWRPNQSNSTTRQDEVPVIAVALIAASPQSPQVVEAASDLKEQLVHNLSRRTGIRVLPIDGQEISESDAQYLLRGRFRAHGETARVMLSLVRTDSSHVVWSETYEGLDDDYFTLSDEVAGMADNALRVQINAFDADRLSGIPDDELTPSELRSRSAQLFHTADVGNYERAEGLLERALLLDPNNPMTLGMMIHAVVWPSLARFSTLPDQIAQRMMNGADEAVRQAPRSDFVFFSRAELRAFLLGDMEGALKDIARAHQINPTYVWAFETRAKIEMVQGNYADAIETLQTVVERSKTDPWLPRRLFLHALAKTLDGRHKEALTDVSDALDLLPDRHAYWHLLAHINQQLGDDAGYKSALERAANASSDPHVMVIELRLQGEGAELMKKFAPLAESG